VVGIVGKSKSLDFPTMLIFWSLVRNSVVLAVYLLFSVACFLTVHEHYFKDYKNEKFNLDTIEKQQRIVDILKKTENIIESRQQELQKLDDLIRARFTTQII
ncbi:hypothetical protein, partial [Mogibacterium sp.]|uniref:hypothetical protein n=1 Tax=Mogibacterium sp. TaxID=2049035 RepID=UPI002ED2EFC2|nr:hypothetical protein [Mogibacterium sp.]